jgi:hypothetical protein
LKTFGIVSRVDSGRYQLPPPIVLSTAHRAPETRLAAAATTSIGISRGKSTRGKITAASTPPGRQGRLDHRCRLVDGIDMLDVVGQSRGERSRTTTNVKDPFASLG